jgi:hypothetical protein
MANVFNLAIPYFSLIFIGRQDDYRSLIQTGRLALP